MYGWMFCPLIGWMFCPLIGWMFGPLIGWMFGPLIGWMFGPFVGWMFGPLISWIFGIENYLLNSEIYMDYDSRDAKIYLTYWLLQNLVYIQFPKSSVTTRHQPSCQPSPPGLAAGTAWCPGAVAVLSGCPQPAKLTYRH